MPPTNTSPKRPHDRTSLAKAPAPSTWTVEYEQGSPSGFLGCMTFDEEIQPEGSWHRLSARSRAVYRVTADVMQIVKPLDGEAVGSLGAILEILEPFVPFAHAENMLLIIMSQPSGFLIWDPRGSPGTEEIFVPALTKIGLSRALRELYSPVDVDDAEAQAI